ncbi:MAG: mechanosensitive ion channel family protein [Verrucomicrobia bacterium]|nr:mechanosensitive ion channel family protein [Verrucomicrobiota bacterium]MCF7708477.1 mechanosensitive ion channel family protein [Verrucomicrobiota bacterium]
MKTRFAFCMKLGVVFCVLLASLTCVLGQTNNETPPPEPPVMDIPEASPVDEVAGSVEVVGDTGRITFGLDEVGILEGRFLGVPLWQYAASAVFIILAFVAAIILDRLLLKFVRKFVRKLESRVADATVKLFETPVRLIIFVILLHAGLKAFDWPEWLKVYLLNGLNIVIGISLTFVVVRVLDMLLILWRNRSPLKDDKAFNDQMFPLIRKCIIGFIIVTAILVIAQNLGFSITGALASLSIGGLALGLAAQDTLANLFGGISVFLDKPFQVGERVLLDKNVDGVIEYIGLRSTWIRNLDGHLVSVPNKTVANATITNIAKRPNIKTVMNIGITYDTPTEKVERAYQILEEVYKKHPMTFDVWISFNAFAESSLNFLVIHWWNSVDYKAYLEGMQTFNLEIKRRFDAERITFAFPSRTIFMKQDSDFLVRSVTAGVSTAAHEKNPEADDN